MADEGYREIHLTGKQLVFVFMAATVVAVVIFLLGVLVGRGVQAARPSPEPALVSAPQLIPDAPAAGAAQAPPVDEGSAPVPPPADEFSYPERLDAKDQPAESLKPAGGSPPPERPAAPAAADRASAEPARKPAAAPTTKAPAPGQPDAAAEAGGLSVQVAAVKKRAEADAIVKRLQQKGYRAFVYTPAGKGPATMFRVRVGPFKTREEAEASARRLQQEEQYKPWIIR